MNLHMCFTCPARFCEVLPGDLGGGAIFLQELVGRALTHLPSVAKVIAVELDFCISRSSYFVQIHIRCNKQLAAILYECDAWRLQIECVVSQAMLQSFWEVSSSECRDCPG